MLNVLIVEDEIIIALHIDSIVKRMGHAVAGLATNEEEAMKYADEKRVDLLISDIRLGDGRDGIEIAEQLQTEHGCAVILITAYKDQETLKKALNLELEGYLVKPFSEPRLRGLIGSVADRYGCRG
ncbi:histidine kinase response regulator hybrid protein [Hydrogenimonas sp.]|nr:histidine kinase response regulator hybrid protein [Hydrogenimonas sp.]